MSKVVDDSEQTQVRSNGSALSVQLQPAGFSFQLALEIGFKSTRYA